MKVETLRGDAARSRANSADFQRDWEELLTKCPWATVYQSPKFVLPWYEAYKETSEPVLVFGFENGRLAGLFSLALEADKITAAGSWHCEYPVWIALPEYQDAFPDAAIRAIQEAFRPKLLRLMFVPPGTPLGFSAKWKASVVPVRRALVDLSDTAKVRESLRKKSNKSRLSRLARRGAVEFRKIDNPEVFDATLDLIGVYCDFRHGAVEGDMPFYGDPRKAPFYRAMARTPGLLHTTFLMCGDQLAAAHIGLQDRDSVGLGLIAHSPFLSQDSAGKIQLLLLIQQLAQEGLKTFDLTPGGDYKDRFSNTEDEAYTVTFYFTPKSYIQYRLRSYSAAVSKSLLARLRLDPKRVADRIREKLVEGLSRASRTSPRELPVKAGRFVQRWMWRRSELRLYSMDVRDWKPLPEDPRVRRDEVNDLLRFVSAESWQPSRRQFLRHASELIETGNHCYTVCEGEKLVHYGWLLDRQEISVLGGGRPDWHFPPNSAVAFDFYTLPEARGRGLYRKSLSCILNAAASVPGTERVFICVEADNAPSRRVIEKLGFEYEKSIVTTRRFGKWRHQSLEPEPANTTPGPSHPLTPI